jgi:hypothetical protein
MNEFADVYPVFAYQQDDVTGIPRPVESTLTGEGRGVHRVQFSSFSLSFALSTEVEEEVKAEPDKQFNALPATLFNLYLVINTLRTLCAVKEQIVSQYRRYNYFSQ